MRTLKNVGIMLNLKRTSLKNNNIFGAISLFQKVWENNNFVEILKLDLFVKFYDILGHNIIIESFGPKYNFSEQYYCSKIQKQR